ncbi:MAG: hypothetical protein OSA97_06050 [Nevskia sp.]|nr:hypothetical protein [Nevskia sp.]
MKEPIIAVSAEGGSITLLGEETKQGWVFHRQVSDWTATLIGEPDIEHESEIARSWADAIRLMDEYRWYKLIPRSVHPTFRAVVWNEVRTCAGRGLLSEHRMESWREKCAPTPHTAP